MKKRITLCLFACGSIIGGQLIAARLPMAWDGGASKRIGSFHEVESEIGDEYQFLGPGHVSAQGLYDLIRSTQKLTVNEAAWP